MRRKENIAWAKKPDLLLATSSLFCVVRCPDAQLVHSIETLSEFELSNRKFWKSKARMPEGGVEECNLTSGEAQPNSRHRSQGS
jgi:hypothetical protein